MTKKEATDKVRQGVDVGDLREVLNNATDQATDVPSRINHNFTKRFVWNMYHVALAEKSATAIPDFDIAVNIFREFA